MTFQKSEEILSSHPSDNKTLACYYLNNISTFLNATDPLTSGKWVYPQSFFLQSIRTPFQDTSLIKYLLCLPTEYLENGRLFLSIFLRYNPDLLSVPFTSHPFKKNDDTNSSLNIKVLDEGIDYQSVQKLIWKRLFRRYLFSRATWRRSIFSRRMLLLLMLKWIIEYHPLIPLKSIINHWRYRDWMPPMLDQTFVRIEAWLRTYVDPYQMDKEK